ncbi:ABC transporter permease [Vallitalea okinawensis]|uniref:ABC transporter permease n=1 Tax=Vallitalea okinawensis TaxID=2078660 RepID=UPI000CFCDB53|nr:ABC transporter permease subunit [Vallitalea okinawensis]
MNGLTTVKKKSSKTKSNRSLLAYIWFHRYLYLLLVPGIIYYIIFHYIPMYGATIAFKDFNIMKGIIGSPWAGFKHFEYLFSLNKFFQVFKNTIIISLMRLVCGFPAPIIVALLLNELSKMKFKKVIQTVVYLPHFISWVIFGGMLVTILSAETGIVNMIIVALGGEPIGFLTDPEYFRWTLVWTAIYKWFGWNTVIYMAALSGVDTQLYEAAVIDGANRWQRIWHITLPCIKGTIVVLLILRIGNLMQAGFEQIYVLYNPAVYRVSDILDTYVYRLGLSEGKFSLATAIGLFKSVINFVLLISANKIARMMEQPGIY